jgi:hypothetical protein
MSVERFLSHLADLRPRFECEPAGPREDAHIEIEITHSLRPLADSSALTELRRLIIGPNREVEALYAAHDGMDLYIQGETVGLTLYPISSWLAATESFREDIESSGRIEDDLLRPTGRLR